MAELVSRQMIAAVGKTGGDGEGAYRGVGGAFGWLNASGEEKQQAYPPEAKRFRTGPSRGGSTSTNKQHRRRPEANLHGLGRSNERVGRKKKDMRLTRVGSGQQWVNVPSHCTKDPPLHKVLELFTCDKNRTHRNNSACRSYHSTIFVSVFLSPSPHTVLPSTRTYLALRNITVVAIRIRAVVSYPAAMLLLHVEAVR